MRIAAGLIRKAVKGDASAQYLVGTKLATDAKSDQVLATALQWYARSAAQGHAEATYNQALMVGLGEGCASDLKAARVLMRQAAIRGSSDANEYLAEVYSGGLNGYKRSTRNAIA
jgi:TPR repeat protein